MAAAGGFGAVDFVPSSNPITGPAFTSSADNDDDDWGDFINSTGGALPLPKTSKPLDLFGSFPNQNQDVTNGPELRQPSSVPAARASSTAPWEKPRGALPLSIFGELEEEEEEKKEKGSGVGDLLFADSKSSNPGKKAVPNVSDLIANLYTAEKASRSDSIIGKGARSGSNWDWVNPATSASNVDSATEQPKLDSNQNGRNFDTNVENLVAKDEKLMSNGGFDNEDDYDDGWEFQGAESKTAAGGDDFNKGAEIKAENGPLLNFSGANSTWNFPRFDGIGMNSSANTVNSDAKQINSDLFDESEDVGDTDDWGFKTAASEYVTTNGNVEDGGRMLENPKESMHTFGFANDTFANGDLFDASHGGTNISGGFDVNPNPSTVESSITSSYIKSGQNDTENESHFSVNEEFDDDGNSWAFKDAFSESQPKNKEEQKVAEISPAMEEFAIHSKIEENKVHTENQKGALPLSIFGDEENEDDHPSVYEDISSPMFSSNHKDGIKKPHLDIPISDLISSLYGQSEQSTPFNDTKNPSENGMASTVIASNLASAFTGFDDDSWEFRDASLDINDGAKNAHSSIPVTDLMSSLYSQDEQNSSFDHAKIPNENGTDSTKTVLASNLLNADNSSGNSWEFKAAFSEVNADDDFDDNTWEFKDAMSGTKTEDQIEKACTEYPTKIEIQDYVDFFSKLKDELYSVALCHLENLKKAQGTALTGEDANLQALEKEIQDLKNELQDDHTANDLHLDSSLSRTVGVNEFVKILQEPKFQSLESEYQLSQKLSLVENNWRSAIELLKNVASTQKILTFLSSEEQSKYVSIWSKVLSICLQELKHGALIWKKALQNNVQDQILSKPQGKKQIIALGEIYRVVELLGSSVRLYKPWILASSIDTTGMSSCLSECSTLWSSSGLKEALGSIADPDDIEYDGSPKTLLESIEQIHDLDASALYNIVFSGQGTTCRLSLLTTGTTPGMRTVMWNGECYFVTLANLWANLISCGPPTLPNIHVG